MKTKGRLVTRNPGRRTRNVRDRHSSIINRVSLARPLNLRCEAWLKDIDGKVLDHLARQVERYGVKEIAFAYPWSHGGSAFNTYATTPKVAKKVDAKVLREMRAALKRMKRLGLKTILISGEPAYPEALFEKIPEFRNAGNGGFWTFIEEKTAEIFRQLPDLDAFQFYLWERGFVNDGHIFSDLHVVPSHCPYGRADYLADLIESYGRGARAVGRKIEVLTFSHFPWQEQVLIEALRGVDRSLPISLMHKFVSGDFDIFKPTNKVIQAFPDWSAGILFDTAGEYYGKGEIPFCYPEEIQARLQHALESNPHIDTLAGRAIVLDSDTFQSFNEVNFHALSRLAADPYVPIEDVWRDWANSLFGAAAPDAISGLRRTYDIGKLVYYFRGTRAHQHSKIGLLSYLDWIVDGYAVTMARWRPDDSMMRYWQDELVSSPREHTVEWVVADRREALRLCDLSLADVAGAEGRMPPEVYRRLVADLRLQRDFTEVSIRHAEAVVRYFIEKKGRGRFVPGNRRKLSACLRWLDECAAGLRLRYGSRMGRRAFTTHTTGFILDADIVRQFVGEVRKALAMTE